LKHCPRQLTVGKSIAGSRIWCSAAEADGRCEFIFNNFDKKFIIACCNPTEKNIHSSPMHRAMNIYRFSNGKL
jgi:hypothetical protein